MDAHASLIAQFDDLIAPLVTSGVDLATCIERLETSVRSSVPSLLGWSLSVRVDGAPMTMTSIPRGTLADDVRASLRIPLSALLGGGLDGGMVLYASKPHALRRFAAAFVPVLGPRTCPLRLDQDLNPACFAALSGVHLMSPISQAIRLLISRGDTADAARLRLEASARTAHLTLTQSARALLSGLRPSTALAGSVGTAGMKMAGPPGGDTRLNSSREGGFVAVPPSPAF